MPSQVWWWSADCLPAAKGSFEGRSAILNKMANHSKVPTAICFSFLDREMGRMTRLAFAALFPLAATEVAIAKSQQHFTESSLADFRDTCNLSQTILLCTTLASLFFTPPLLGFAN